MLLPLLPLPPNECPNVGGVRALRVWPASNVLPLPVEPGSNLLLPVQLRDPANYADIWFQPDSAGFDEPEGDDAQGVLYKPSLQLLVLRDAPDLQEAIARLRAVRYFVVAYADGNGLTKLVGTPTHPLRLTAGLETGKKPTDRNGYPLAFAGLTRRPAPFTLVQPAGMPPVRRAFSTGFNFGFN
ncbi:hypothetical protein [Hymenobacter cheonanensis]|uniref:hypothetical protein n=1 Tax=Hymenobacter sp. CA2-7 TaxID=3063993 RepID=UPI002713C273|nr:hypothetical protein [Hymenobacter sp. CA2-7]MDO7885341.1 hypothetical protein [Hymenobacter sp. CA2-7]